MIGSIGWMEIVIIAVLALLIVGPKGLPKLGKSVGRAIRDFKREANELKSAVELEVEEEERREAETARKARPKKKKEKAGGK